MPISDKTIVDSDDAKPGVPIRKATLAWIVVVFMLVAALTAVVMDSQQEVARASQLNAAPVPQEQAKITGSPSVIDEESRRAQRNSEIVSVNTAPQNPNQVIVPGLKGNPNGGDANLLGKTGAALTKTSVSDRAEVDLAIDTSARMAPVVKFDEGSAAVASSGPGFGDSGRNSSPDPSDLGASSGSGSGASDAGGYVPPSIAARSAAALALGSRIGAGPSMTPQSSLTGNRQWLNEYAQEGNLRTSEAIKSYPTTSKFTLHQGKVIPAVLGRKLNSDLPGEVTAYVSQDVYDSLGNGSLLIPKGSSLVGRYNSEVRIGQDRMLFAFQRLIMPNGRSFDLPVAQASDMTGASGVEGDVNNHFFKMFATSFLIAWSANQVAQPSNVTINGSAAPQNPAGQILVDIGRTVLQRNTSIPPTITLDQGTRINVQVAKDMEFPGPYKRSVN